jgi:hypothetical protein
MDLIVREALRLTSTLTTPNREGAFCLSKSLKPLIGFLKISGHDPMILGEGVPHS